MQTRPTIFFSSPCPPCLRGEPSFQTTKIFSLTKFASTTCINITPKNLRISALDNMKATLNTPQSILDRLYRLTRREKEICILHFIEGRSQTLIAEWLGLTLRSVQLHITNAVAKVPELEPLRVKSLEEVKRPKLFHLSQLKPTERGPFNADEI